MDLHRSLCNVYDTSEEELREVMEKANSLIEDILKKKPCLASECNSQSLENIDTGQFQCAAFDDSVALYFIFYMPFAKFSFFPSAFNAEGLIYFEDLMEESSLSSSLEILEKDYEDAIRNKGELDERVFVNDEDSLLGSGSLSAGAVTMSGIKVFSFELCSYSLAVTTYILVLFFLIFPYGL